MGNGYFINKHLKIFEIHEKNRTFYTYHTLYTKINTQLILGLKIRAKKYKTSRRTMFRS